MQHSQFCFVVLISISALIMSLVSLFTDAEPPSAWFPKEMRAELRMLREGWEELQSMFYEVWRCMKHLELL